MRSSSQNRRPAGRVDASRTDRLWLWWLSIGLASLGAYWAVPTVAGKDVAFVVFHLAGAAGVLVAIIRAEPSQRRPWMLIAAGLLMGAAGNALYAYYELVRGAVPYPGPPDVLFCLTYPFYAAGILAIARARSSGADRVALLDATVVAVPVAILVWGAGVSLVPAISDWRTVEQLLWLRGTVGSAAVLAVAIRLAAGRGHINVSARWIVAAACVFSVGDLAYTLLAATGTYRTGHPVDGTWLGATVLWAVAALHPSMRDITAPRLHTADDVPPTRIGLLVAAMAVASTGTVALVAGQRGAVAAVVAGSVVLPALVVLRLHDMFRRAARHAAATRSAERQFRAMAEAASDIIWRVAFGQPPRFVYINGAVEELLGVRRDVFERDADAFLRLVHPDDRRLFASGENPVDATVRYRIQTGDGRWIWLEDRRQVVRDDRGIPLGLQGIAREVTDEELSRRALEDLATELRRTAEVKDQLISMVSHELRTPLTPIRGFAEALRRQHGAAIGSGGTRMLDAIERNSDRMLHRIEALLMLSELTAGTVRARAVDVDLGTVLETLVGDLGPTVGAVDLRLAPDIGEVHAWVDPTHLEVCLSNLLVNAAKYGDAPTTVDVDVTPDGCVRVEVRDRGPGLPSGFETAAFEPFMQASTGERRTATGVGLGLAIVRSLTELNGGACAYEQADPGARFVLTFPRFGHTHTIPATGAGTVPGRELPTRLTIGGLAGLGLPAPSRSA